MTIVGDFEQTITSPLGHASRHSGVTALAMHHVMCQQTMSGCLCLVVGSIRLMSMSFSLSQQQHESSVTWNSTSSSSLLGLMVWRVITPSSSTTLVCGATLRCSCSVSAARSFPFARHNHLRKQPKKWGDERGDKRIEEGGGIGGQRTHIQEVVGVLAGICLW